MSMRRQQLCEKKYDWKIMVTCKLSKVTTFLHLSSVLELLFQEQNRKNIALILHPSAYLRQGISPPTSCIHHSSNFSTIKAIPIARSGSRIPQEITNGDFPLSSYELSFRIK
jgi:hypothetical protein